MWYLNLQNLICVCLMLISTCVKAQYDPQAVKLMDELVAYDTASAIITAPSVISVDYTDSNNTTLLMAASKQGCRKVCEILIDRGAKLDLQDKYGSTALIYASAFGKSDVVSLLIRKGANSDLKNNSGKTAFIIANQNGNYEIAGLLESKLESESPTNIKNSERPNSDVNPAKNDYVDFKSALSISMEAGSFKVTSIGISIFNYLTINQQIVPKGLVDKHVMERFVPDDFNSSFYLGYTALELSFHFYKSLYGLIGTGYSLFSQDDNGNPYYTYYVRVGNDFYFSKKAGLKIDLGVSSYSYLYYSYHNPFVPPMYLDQFQFSWSLGLFFDVVK